MALYVYKCKPCGETFELLRPRAERNSPASCPKCGADKAKRLVAQPFSTTRASPPLPVGASPSALGAFGPNATLKNVRITNAATGLYIGKGATVKSSGLIIDNTVTAIDNSGVFDGPDTVIK